MRYMKLLCIAISFLASVASYAAEDASSGIASFRDGYLPVEYLPEGDFWLWLDLSALLACLCLGAVLCVRRNSPPSRLLWLMLGAFLYFGLLRGGCICPVGAIGDIAAWISRPELIGRATAAAFLLPLCFAFFCGRVFCSSSCPLGALQALLSWRNPPRLPRLADRLLNLLPAFVLAAQLYLSIRGVQYLVCLLDPYKTLFWTGHAWLGQLVDFLRGSLCESGLLWVGDIVSWSLLALVLLLGFWVPRPFCRFACPYGALLGIFSIGAFRRRVPGDACVKCGACERICPMRAISMDAEGRPQVSMYQCVQCGKCATSDDTGGRCVSPR